MRKLVFILILTLLASANLSAQSNNSGVFVENNGYEIFIPVNNAKSFYKIGQTIEITRNRWGNTNKVSNWEINPSPILGENEDLKEERRQEPCASCTVGAVIMTYYFVKTKIIRII